MNANVRLFLNFLLIVSLPLSGCFKQQDLGAPEGSTQGQAAGPRYEPEPPIGVLIPSVLEFKEGEDKEYQLEFRTQDRSKPVVEVTGLPAGARFDSTTYKLNWKPEYDAANDAANPAVTTKTHTVDFSARLAQNRSVRVARRVTFLVTDNPRKFDFENLNTTITGKEGTTIQSKFTLVNEDFESGPFIVSADSLPAGAALTRGTGRNEYILSYTPGFDVVSRATGQWTRPSYVKTSRMRLFALNPRGRIIQSKEVVLNVSDVRLPAVISAPTRLQHSAEASFMITADDPNREESPSIELSSRSSELGTVEVTPSATGTVASASVLWKEIPPGFYGTTQRLVFAICTGKSDVNVRKCVDHSVAIQFAHAVPYHAPEINRASWTLGQLQMIREGDTLSLAIPVVDIDFPGAAPQVALTSSEPTDQLSYSNGVLSLRAGKPGFRQILLVATGTYGMKSTEVFSAVVLEGVAQ